MKKPFAVFDIDGTLARWSLHSSVVENLIKSHALTGEAYERMRLKYDKWRLRTHKDSYNDYEVAIVEAWDRLLSEVSHDEFITAARTEFEARKDHTYIYTKKLLQDLKQQGYFLIALSGSHQEIISQMADYHGFDLGIGSQYLTRDGQFTGESIVPALDKGAALKTLVAEHNLDITKSVGVGDTAGDIAMLELVSHPIAFNPESKLKDRAIKDQWQIVVERKNCTYSLIPTANGFKLEI